MNAQPEFIAASAHVDDAAVKPLPRSRKVYIEGSRPDMRVPMRVVEQTATPAAFGAEANPPVYVYDTSGPYTDPLARIDIRLENEPSEDAAFRIPHRETLRMEPSVDAIRAPLAEFAVVRLPAFD